ncbi:hypothetical protein D3C73_765290 [compost metagenome]
MRGKVKVIITNTVGRVMATTPTTGTNKEVTEVGIMVLTTTRTIVQGKTTTNSMVDRDKEVTTNTQVDQDKVRDHNTVIVLTIEVREDLLRIRKSLLKRKSKIKSRQHLLV